MRSATWNRGRDASCDVTPPPIRAMQNLALRSQSSPSSFTRIVADRVNVADLALRRRMTRVMLILLSLLLSSCIIPIRQEITVGRVVKLTVLDAASRQPVANASLWFDGFPETTTHSDEHGAATLTARRIAKTFWMPPAPVDPPPWFLDYAHLPLRVSAPKYRSAVVSADSHVSEVSLTHE